VGSAILSIAGPDANRQAELDESAKQMARMMVDICQNQIRCIAEELAQRRTLTGSEVEEALNSVGANLPLSAT